MSELAPSRRGMLAGSVALTLGACVPGAQGGRVLRSADTHPDGYPTVEAVRHFGSELARLTGDRLRLKLYGGGQLGEEKDTLELTLLGGLDLNRVNLAPLNAIAPETLVPSLPFLFRDEAHMRAAMDGAPGRAVLEALSAHGLKGLAFYDSGARSFYTKSRPIRTPDDLRGLKIRVQNSDLFVAMVEGLGGNATPMSFGEVYQGLLQGVVDGAENNWPSYESTRHFEAAPIYSLTRHVMAPEVLVMSLRRWERLGAPDQDAVLAAAAASVPVMRGLWDERSRQAEARLRAAGTTIIEDLDLAAFRTRMEPVWARFAAKPTLRRLVEDTQAMGAARA